MKILFTALYPLFNHNFVSELNLIVEKIEQGDEIYVIECASDYAYCECNQKYLKEICFKCNLVFKENTEKLLNYIKILPAIYKQKNIHIPEEVLSSYQSLSSFKHENFDAGSAVLSSLCDISKTPKPDISGRKNDIKKMLYTACDVYCTAEYYIKTHKFSKIYIFNGRFTHARAWLRAAQQAKVPYTTIERGGDSKQVSIFENDIPHNFLQYNKKIINNLEAKKEIIDFNQCEEWFKERTFGVSRNWHSFVSEQKSGLLGNLLHSNKLPIVFFLSTDYEFASIPEVFLGFPLPQQEALLQLIIDRLILEANSDHIILRVHPNSAESNNRFWDKYKSITQIKIDVIDPESPISSYELLRSASKVVTFGSTIGLEATYWGVPSILAGPAIYMGLDAVYEPNNVEEIINFLKMDLLPKPKINALKVSAYFLHGDHDLKYIDFINIQNIRFKPPEHFKSVNKSILFFLQKKIQVFRWMPKWKAKIFVYLQKALLILNKAILKTKTIYDEFTPPQKRIY
jgi:hypothetical protein